MPDPVEADEASFNNFYTWVQARLKESGLFEFQTYKAHLQFSVGEAFKSPFGVIRLIGVCARRPIFTLRFFLERLFGESLARRLALAWIKQTKVY